MGDSAKFFFIYVLVRLIQANILHVHLASVTVVGNCAGLQLVIKTIASEYENKSFWRMPRIGCGCKCVLFHRFESYNLLESEEAK